MLTHVLEVDVASGSTKFVEEKRLPIGAAAAALIVTR